MSDAMITDRPPAKRSDWSNIAYMVRATPDGKAVKVLMNGRSYQTIQSGVYKACAKLGITVASQCDRAACAVFFWRRSAA